jgi:polyphosphate kinase
MSTPAAAVHATLSSQEPDPLREAGLYLNREISQLDFNFRVLAQAQDDTVPLLERLRYLCISCTNLDEFFEIRAATVRHAQEFDMPLAADGIPHAQLLKLIHERAAQLVDAQYRCWNEVLRPALKDAGVRVLARQDWTARQTRWLRAYFRDEILPVLSPLGLDPAHPFPKILNKSLNIVVVLKGKDAFGRAGHLAIVRAPRSLPRIIQLPQKVSGGEHDFVFLSAVLSAFVDELFPGMQVKGAYQFRVTRNSELVLDRKKSRTSRSPCATNSPAAATCARCGWRSPPTARRQSCAPCCRTSSCQKTPCTASTARSTSTAPRRSTTWRRAPT